MGKNDSDVLVDELLQAIEKIRTIKLSTLRDGDIRNSERFTLLLLHRFSQKGSVSPSDIAKKLDVTMGAVTHHLNALEEGGYITRTTSEEDKRASEIFLTTKGHTMIDTIHKEREEKLHKLVAYLGEEDSKTLIALITKISTFIQQG